MTKAFDHITHQQHLNLHETRVVALRQNLGDIESRIADHEARPLLRKLFGPKTELDDPAFRAKLRGSIEKKLAFAESELKRAEDDFHREMDHHLATSSDRYRHFIKARDLYTVLHDQASQYAVHARELLKTVGIARNTMAVSSNAASNTYSETAKSALSNWLAAYTPVHRSETQLKVTLTEYNRLVRGSPFSAVSMPTINSVSDRPTVEIGGISYAEKRKLLESQKEMLDQIVPELPSLSEAIKFASGDFEKALRDYRRKRHDEALTQYAEG